MVEESKFRPFSNDIPIKPLIIFVGVVIIVAALAGLLFLFTPKSGDTSKRSVFVLRQSLIGYITENSVKARTAHRRFGLTPDARTGRSSDYLNSVVQSVPGSLDWKLELPKGVPRLDFTVGYSCKEGAVPRPVGVRVLIDGDGRTETLYENGFWVRRPENDFVFYREEILLRGYAGREVTLTFESSGETADGGEVDVLWGNPTISVVEKTTLPNVVLVCIDALRKDRVQCYNADSVLTPNLQRLAEDGVVFENAVAQAPWTVPSVTSVLTGLSPSLHAAGKRILLETDRSPEQMEELRKEWGLVLPGGRNVYGISSLRPRIPTLPELLGGRYATHFVNGNAFLSADIGVLNRFQTYSDGAVHGHTLTEQAKRWLDDNFDRLFFVSVHYMGPHEWINHYKEKTGDEELSDRPAAKAVYDELVRREDMEFGRLIRRLKELRLYDNTLIVVYADHGELLWDADSGLIGHGNTLRSQLLEVPLIVKFPRSAHAGERVADAVKLIDIFPTITQASEVETGEAILPQAVSLRDVAEGKLAGREREIISEFLLFDKEGISIRKGKYRLVYDIERGTSALFESGTDKPVDKEESEETRAAAALLEQTLKSYIKLAEKVGGKPRLIRPDEEDLERLKELGYLQ
jgi:arylsulfatase A-like enzyme